jgi:hypothetical protein
MQRQPDENQTELNFNPPAVPQAKVPNAFPNELGRIPRNPVITAHVEAICKGGTKAREIAGGWLLDRTGDPIIVHKSKTGDEEIVIYVEAEAFDASPDSEQKKKKWEVVEECSAWTLDTFLSLLAQLCEPGAFQKCVFGSDETTTHTSINASTILRNKGIQRRGRHEVV